MPMIREVLYWPKHLRNKVKRVVQHFQQEELKSNKLAQTGMRDVILVCVALALEKVKKMPLKEFRRKVNELKAKG